MLALHCASSISPPPPCHCLPIPPTSPGPLPLLNLAPLTLAFLLRSSSPTSSYIPAVLPSCTWLYSHRLSSLSLMSAPNWDLCISSPFAQRPWLRPTHPQVLPWLTSGNNNHSANEQGKHFQIYKNLENLFSKNCYYRNKTNFIILG